ncbi:MAG: radical SAM protein [Myxococcaceae bacterium]
MVPPGYALRVNVLEQCQYRCLYCLPGSVSPYTPNKSRLTPPEYARLAPLFVRAGVRKVRFTGGEPLLREDLPDIVRAFRTALPVGELAVTTNGEHLPKMLDALVEAGLDRATVHVDSLRPDRYRTLMGDGDVGAVLEGLLEARTRLREVKLNVVVQRGGNDDELTDFLDWSLRHGIQVRFIELMNTGSARDYVQVSFFSGRDIVARIAERESVEPLPRASLADPAALYRTRRGIVFGVIASDTEPFCASCNRLRLTPDGKLRGCLYQSGGVALGSALRAGAEDAELERMLALGIRNKRSHHPSVAAERVPFSMSESGG